MKELLRFLRLYRPYRLEIMVGLALSLVTLCAGIALLAVSGWFIAAMALAGALSVSVNYFSPAAIIRGLSIIRTVGRYGERLVNHDAALRVTSEFRQRFYNSLVPLIPASLQDFHSADIFDRMRTDVETLERFYLNGIVPILTSLFALIILFVFLLFYNPALAIIECGILIVVGFILPTLVKNMACRDAEHIAAQGKSRRILLGETIQAMDEILVYQQADSRLSQLLKHDLNIANSQKKIHLRESLVQALTVMAVGVTVFFVIMMVSPDVQSKTMAPENLAMLALLSIAAFDIILPLPAAYHSFYAARIAARRIYDILDLPTAEPDFVSAGSQHIGSEKFSLLVDRLSFSYQEKPVFSNLEFALSAGEVLAICGPSGSGKSTILGILAGFWTPASGDIRVNGHNINHWGPEDRRAMFGFAPQKPYLFADTIRQNLCLANPHATDDQLRTACEQADIWNTILSMPDGLDTYVGEHGIGLSGGQIRRLGLARALLCEAPCLVLDEPGEGLDAMMEENILRTLIKTARQQGQAVLLFLHDAEKAWLPEDVKITRL